MNRPSILSFIVCLLGTMLFIGGTDAANLSLMQAVAKEKPATATMLDLHYGNGLIDIHIDHAPLEKVLHALTLKTGIEINLSDPIVASWPVSVSVKAVPLEQAIQTILDGFSYALYHVADRPVVIVLSTKPRPARTGLHTHPVEKLTPQPPTNTPDKVTPQSLDEFQSITIEEPSSDPEVEGKQAADPSVRWIQEQEYQETLLHRALDALKSEHKHLHAEAIDQLTILRDPRATEALVEAVSSSTVLDPKSRLQAVGTVWQYAEDQHFADATSVNVLKQLTEDSDENIRSLARQALKEMEHYQNSAQ